MSKKWKPHPVIYEINTWPWLNDLSNQFDEKITLKNIPETIFRDRFKHFDAIWLMGVWTRSPQGKKIAQTHPGLLKDYNEVLNDFSIHDVIGSPYAIFDYSVDLFLGGQEGLAIFHDRLQKMNTKLILDFVPNHVACDHPWAQTHPEFFIHGKEEDIQSNPSTFFKINGHIYAHGKDPYFDAWTDTIQINAFSQPFRNEMIGTLQKMSSFCEGVRCDMAMLLDDQIFKKTWQNHVGDPLKKRYWVELISAVKNQSPDFKFIAEVYWDMEWELQQQGFDFCYDKRLYDRLKSAPINDIKGHLDATWEYQSKLVRFIENHDEPRAFHVFDEKKLQPLAVLAVTLPGAYLHHWGQSSGRSIKLPVQLNRYPTEPKSDEISSFYHSLFTFLMPDFGKEGKWKMLDLEEYTLPMNKSTIIAYVWVYSNEILLIFCNLSNTALNYSFSSKKIRELGVDFDYLRCQESISSDDSLSISSLDLDHNYDLGLSSFGWYLGRFSIEKR
jgi:glycosidase